MERRYLYGVPVCRIQVFLLLFSMVLFNSSGFLPQLASALAVLMIIDGRHLPIPCKELQAHQEA